MKRNKAKARAERAGSSPYAKYSKRPHRYSDAYYAWRRTVARNVAHEEKEVI